MSNLETMNLGAAVWEPHAHWKRLHKKGCASTQNEYGELLESITLEIGSKKRNLEAMIFEDTVLVIFMGYQYHLTTEEFRGIRNTDLSQTSSTELTQILRSFHEA